MQLHIRQPPSPLGPLLLVTDGQQHIRALGFADGQQQALLLHRLSRQYGPQTVQPADAPATITHALARYFAGECNALDTLPVALGGTSLQRKVWLALRSIAAGSTCSYRQLAQAAGMQQPRAAQAVGSINAANLIAIVLPCHRVIGSDGMLKGYAWGIERKRWLLEHEGALPQQEGFQAGFSVEVFAHLSQATPASPPPPKS